MSLSTPVGYSLTDWQFVAAVSNLSANGTLSVPRGSESNLRGNGTGVLALGVPLGRYGSATLSHMVLSNLGDNAQNLVWSPPGQRGSVRVALGVQDVSGQGGTQGEGPGRQDPGESRSYFVAATWQPRPGLHVGGGLGDTRFRRGFVNASWNFWRGATAIFEHDGYNWNAGLAYELAAGRGGVTATVGLFRGEFAYWSLAWRF
jgi:hypothetical protein